MHEPWLDLRKVALSGGQGFLGFHTRSALLETETRTQLFRVGSEFDLETATSAISGCQRFVHIAGVNRGDDHNVEESNIAFASQAAEALRASAVPPPMVVFANSIQAGLDSPYGRGKHEASRILARAASDAGSQFLDIELPNLYGEYGQPYYNSVTSTFSHLLAQGEQPVVNQNRELTLLHAQDAADILLGIEPSENLSRLCEHETVQGLLSRLTSMHEVYLLGEIPDVSDRLDRNLFNTYRSYTFPTRTAIKLARHADKRGSFFEVIRTRGGCGQSSFSTTEPGISRGDHFHRRKIERFTVLSGTATISLRKLFTEEIFEFAVTGSEPVAIDMPTMYAHKITNTGDDVLYTSFWTNEIYNPTAPDTIPEAV